MPVTLVGTEGRLRDLAQATVSSTGCELVDLEYRRESEGWKIRLFIDKPGGVSLDDCRRVSQDLGTVLEVEDPIPHRYVLEVSSPGLDRRLTRPEDFEAAVGKRVRLVTGTPIQGRRNFSGVLVSASPLHAGGELTLMLRDESGVEHIVPTDGLERARLVFDWPQRSEDRAGKPNTVRPTPKRSKNKGR